MSKNHNTVDRSSDQFGQPLYFALSPAGIVMHDPWRDRRSAELYARHNCQCWDKQGTCWAKEQA